MVHGALLGDVAHAVDLQQHAVEALVQSEETLLARQHLVARRLRSDEIILQALKLHTHRSDTQNGLGIGTQTRDWDEGRIMLIVIFFLFVLMWFVFQAWPPAVKRLRKAGFPVGEWHISPSLQPSGGPLLDEDGEQDALNYEPSVVWVLATTDSDDVVWKGSWRITQDDATKLLNAIEKSIGDSGNTDGRLKLEELQAFAEKHKQDKKTGDLGNLPTSAKGVYVPSVVKLAFREYDRDGNGYLDADEWHDFLRHLEILHLQYLHQAALLDSRAFWGRNTPWQPDLDLYGAGNDAHTRIALEDELAHAAGEATLQNPPSSQFQFGPDPDTGDWGTLPQGWWSDLCFNLANSHSLWGIVACDPLHPLTGMERLVIEISTLGFMLYTERLRKHEGEGFMLMGGITLAGIVISAVLTHLFTTPGYGHVDEARATDTQRWRAKCIQFGMGGIGYALVLLSGILCYLFLRNSDRLAQYLALALLGRGQGYILEILYKFFWTFNPYIAWGEPDPRVVASPSWYQSVLHSVQSIIGLGQWRLEKQRFQRSCSLGLAEMHAEDSNFTNPLEAIKKMTSASALSKAVCC